VSVQWLHRRGQISVDSGERQRPWVGGAINAAVRAAVGMRPPFCDQHGQAHARGDMCLISRVSGPKCSARSTDGVRVKRQALQVPSTAKLTAQANKQRRRRHQKWLVQHSQSNTRATLDDATLLDPSLARSLLALCACNTHRLHATRCYGTRTHPCGTLKPLSKSFGGMHSRFIGRHNRYP
jgi:hypothetical protein